MQRRKEVNWFADQMEKELQANDHKGGWRNCYIRDMLIRIPEEYTELVEAVVSGDIERIVSEAADVANFALMVADLAYRYGVPNTERGLTTDAPEISTQEAIDKITDYLVDLEAHRHGIEISDVKRFLREQIFR